MSILGWDLAVLGEPMAAPARDGWLKRKLVDPGLCVEEVVRKLGMRLLCDGLCGDVERLESFLVRLYDAIFEKALQVLPKLRMSHEREFDG